MVENDDQPKDKKHFTVVIERAGLAGAKVLIWALIAGAVCFYFWSKYIEIPGNPELLNFESSEAFEYGQLARNNLRGEWFRTDMIRPVELWLNRSVHGHPNLYHPPAYPVALAGLMSFLGARDWTLLVGSAVFYFLGLPVLYFATQSMFTKRIARLGLFFFLIMPAVGIAAVSGTPAMFATFLVTAFFALLSAVKPRRYALTVLAGLVLGLCALTATRYAFLILPAVGYFVLVLRRKAWAHVPILVGVALLVMLPWGLRNVRLAGSPWPAMDWTSSYQLAVETQERAGAQVREELAAPHAMERSFSPTALGPDVWRMDKGRSIVRNLRLGLGDLTRYGAQSVLIILFVAGIVVRSKNRHAEWLRMALYAGIVIDLAYGAVARPDSFLLLPYVPFMVVIGAFTFVELIGRLGYTRPISRFALIAVLIAVALAQAVLATNPADALKLADRDRRVSALVLKEIIHEEGDLEPEAVVLSNVPAHTAWYLDRPSIWLPPRYEDLMRLRMQTDEKISFTFLAGYALSEKEPSYETWNSGFREGRMPDSFGLVPFRSTMLSRRRHVYTSFISAERREALVEQARGKRKTGEPPENDVRSNGEEVRREPN